MEKYWFKVKKFVWNIRSKKMLGKKIDVEQKILDRKIDVKYSE